MHPILFQYGRFTLYTYGLLVALAFLAAFWLTGREAERRGLDRRHFQDLGFLLLVAAIVGSRLFHVLVEWEYYLEHPLQVVKIWEGGLVFYGGFICAALAMIWHVRARALPVWTTCDVMSPALALGQALGRLGCFFAGCCYGANCTLPWAVTFTETRGLAPVGTPLHPTQLYSALANLSIFAILYFVARPRQRFEGQIFGLYLMLYPAARFVIEFFRDDPRGALGPLSTSQALGIPLLLFGIWILIRRKPAT
jgi:phosphatidylglycerol:prolipoprotein diacylglycerol transferase